MKRANSLRSPFMMQAREIGRMFNRARGGAPSAGQSIIQNNASRGAPMSMNDIALQKQQKQLTQQETKLQEQQTKLQQEQFLWKQKQQLEQTLAAKNKPGVVDPGPAHQAISTWGKSIAKDLHRLLKTASGPTPGASSVAANQARVAEATRPLKGWGDHTGEIKAYQPSFLRRAGDWLERKTQPGALGPNQSAVNAFKNVASHPALPWNRLNPIIQGADKAVSSFTAPAPAAAAAPAPAAPTPQGSFDFQKLLPYLAMLSPLLMGGGGEEGPVAPAAPTALDRLAASDPYA